MTYSVLKKTFVEAGTTLYKTVGSARVLNANGKRILTMKCADGEYLLVAQTTRKARVIKGKAAGDQGVHRRMANVLRNEEAAGVEEARIRKDSSAHDWV